MNEIMTIGGVDCYEEDGTAYLKLESVARGLGFTKTDVAVSETSFRKEYVRIDWPRVRKYLEELGVPACWHENSQTTGKDGLPEFIPENIFYRLAMKARNETAEKFQALVADEIIPSIRKTGSYGRCTPKLDGVHLKAMELIAGCSADRLPYMAMILQDVGIHPTINMCTYGGIPNASTAEKEHTTNRKTRINGSPRFPVEDFLQGVNPINRPTNDVYQEYVSYCSAWGIDPISNIVFSKMVNKILGTRVMQKKINNANRKIFIR